MPVSDAVAQDTSFTCFSSTYISTVGRNLSFVFSGVKFPAAAVTPNGHDYAHVTHRCHHHVFFCLCSRSVQSAVNTFVCLLLYRRRRKNCTFSLGVGLPPLVLPLERKKKQSSL